MNIPNEPIEVIEHFARLLNVGERHHEVRIIPVSGPPLTGVFSDPVLLARSVLPHDGEAHIYITVNPVRDEFVHRATNQLVPAISRNSVPPGTDLSVTPVTTANEDVASLRWRFLDFDAEQGDFVGYCYR